MTPTQLNLALPRAPRNEREALWQLAEVAALHASRDRAWASARANVQAEELRAMEDVHTRRYPRRLEEAFPTLESRRGFYGPYRRERGHARAVLIVLLVLGLFLAWGVWS